MPAFLARIVSLLLEKLKTIVMRFFFGGRGLGIGGIKINNNKKKMEYMASGLGKTSLLCIQGKIKPMLIKSV